jgi:hypothetical protein
MTRPPIARRLADAGGCHGACRKGGAVHAAPRSGPEMYGLGRALAAAAQHGMAVGAQAWLNAVEQCPGCWALNADGVGLGRAVASNHHPSTLHQIR